MKSRIGSRLSIIAGVLIPAMLLVGCTREQCFEMCFDSARAYGDICQLLFWWNESTIYECSLNCLAYYIYCKSFCIDQLSSCTEDPGLYTDLSDRGSSQEEVMK